MTHPALSDEQAARADALGVAHRLLAGRGEVKGLLSSTSGLLPDELLPAIRVAEYVLTGHYPDTDTTTSATGSTSDTYPDFPTIAGATGSTSDDDGYL